MPNIGTYTIGGAGTDYPGVTGLDDFINAIPVLGLAGDLTAVVVGDVTWTVACRPNYGGYKLRITQGSARGGVTTTPPTVTLAANVMVGASDFMMSSRFELDGLLITGGRLEVNKNNAVGILCTLNVDIKNCVWVNAGIFLAVVDAPRYSYVYNCKFYDGTVYFSCGGIAPGLFENCSMYNPGIGGAAGVIFALNAGGVVVRNSAIVTGGQDWTNVAMSSYPTGYNNYSEDSYGNWAAGSSGNQSGLVAADAWESLDVGESDFLFLKNGTIDRSIDSGANPVKGRAPLDVSFNANFKYTEHPNASALVNAGVAPEQADTDIAGLERPNESGGYSVGCHEADVEWLENSELPT